MSGDELLHLVTRLGHMVHCNSVRQRKNVIQFFVERGYNVHPVTLHHVEEDDDDEIDEYTYLGWDCSCGFLLGYLYVGLRTVIEYELVQDAVEGLENADPIENRDVDDIMSDVMSLLV